MGIEFKDYYKTLGVDQSASPDEIRKAFRQLARQYHPDVAQNKGSAELRFKEINEAYEVLSDAERRKRYDALAQDWRSGHDFHSSPDWGHRPASSSGAEPHKGTNFEFQFSGTGFSEFFEQVFGSSAKQRGQSDRRAHTQNGSGAHSGDDVEAEIVVSLTEALRGSVRPISIQRSRSCEHCAGTGKLKGHGCDACQGQGQTRRIEKYQVKVPAGVREGQRLRLAGQGGSSSEAGRAGDVFLRVRFERHPELRIENDHLVCDLDVTPWEAVLGASVAVPTLEGRVNIRIPPGSQNGQRFRLRGHGLPMQDQSRGDLFASIRIQVPVAVSDTERRLWEKLARESTFKAR